MDLLSVLVIVGAVTGPVALIVGLVALARVGRLRRDISEPSFGVPSLGSQQAPLRSSSAPTPPARTSQLHQSTQAAGVVSDRVRQLAASGQKIAAIKAHREETGLGLKDAKDAVERLG